MHGDYLMGNDMIDGKIDEILRWFFGAMITGNDPCMKIDNMIFSQQGELLSYKNSDGYYIIVQINEKYGDAIIDPSLQFVKVRYISKNKNIIECFYAYEDGIFRLCQNINDLLCCYSCPKDIGQYIKGWNPPFRFPAE